MGVCIYIYTYTYTHTPSLVAQTVKHLPAVRETRVWFLGWEDPLEKEMAIHSSILAWEIPWTEEPDMLQSMGSQRVGHDWATSLHFEYTNNVYVMYIWCCFSVTQSCPILCNSMNCMNSVNCSMLGFPDLAQTHVHWVDDAIQPSHPLSPPPLALNLSKIGVFSNESTLHIRWPKYWSFSLSNEYSGLISFRTGWFDHLAVQGTLKCLQHHSSKVSILWHSALFMVQLSHLYMTTGKIVLSIWTFVSKVMSLP